MRLTNEESIKILCDLHNLGAKALTDNALIMRAKIQLTTEVKIELENRNLNLDEEYSYDMFGRAIRPFIIKIKENEKDTLRNICKQNQTMYCDMIYVVISENGNIIERGTFKTLINEN